MSIITSISGLRALTIHQNFIKSLQSTTDKQNRLLHSRIILIRQWISPPIHHREEVADDLFQEEEGGCVGTINGRIVYCEGKP